MIGLHPEALREIERAHGWYEAHREGLGDDLLDEIGRALDKIEAAPNSFPRAPGEQVRAARSARSLPILARLRGARRRRRARRRGGSREAPRRVLAQTGV